MTQHLSSSSRDGKSAPAIAIVEVGVMLPSASGKPGLDSLWHDILKRRSAVAEIPAGRGLSGHAALLSDDLLTSEDFEYLPCPADSLDPSTLLAIATARRAWQNSATQSIDESRVSVVLGVDSTPTESMSQVAREVLLPAWASRLSRNGEATSYGGSTGSRPFAHYRSGFTAALVSQSLGLAGPVLSVQAGATSLAEVLDIAGRDLLAHRIDAAIVGAVSRPDLTYSREVLRALGGLSEYGEPRPFDKSADGAVPGEGAAMFVLKRLPDAIAHGNSIRAVIRGIGIATAPASSWTAVDLRTQLDAIRTAHRLADWKPDDVDLIECHGSGIPKQDASEWTALNTLWREEVPRWRPGQCVIGSIQANIGYLRSVSAAAGLAKCLCALRDGTLPPQAHFNHAAAGLDLVNSPFQLTTEPRPWRRRIGQEGTQPRRAAIHSLDFLGQASHVLVEEWQPDACQTQNREREDALNGTHSPSSPHQPTFTQTRRFSADADKLAIVGMGATFGNLPTLRAFQEAAFRGKPAVGAVPPERWRGLTARELGGEAFPGAYLSGLAADKLTPWPDKFQKGLPPQAALLLRVAQEAWQDAGFLVPDGTPSESDQTTASAAVIVGQGTDFRLTDQHLRSTAPAWIAEAIGEEALTDKKWLNGLRDAVCSPLRKDEAALESGGSLAALLSASLGCRGRAFGVSTEESSGLAVIQQAARLILDGQADIVVAAAVDLLGEARKLSSMAKLRKFTSESVRPFDASATGMAPGEGGGAVVLKRLRDAVRDGDRVYAVLDACQIQHTQHFAWKPLHLDPGAIVEEEASEAITATHGIAATMNQALIEAHSSPTEIMLFEGAWSGDPVGDDIESAALAALVEVAAEEDATPSELRPHAALGSAQSIIGHAGTASGMASFIKAACCIYQQMLPPTPGFHFPRLQLALAGVDRFHVPKGPTPWLRDRIEGPRRALVTSLGGDGSAACAVLRGLDDHTTVRPAEIRQPLGYRKVAVFAVEGHEVADLLAVLDELDALAGESRQWSAERLARAWHGDRPGNIDAPLAMSLVSESPRALKAQIRLARDHLLRGGATQLDGRDGIFFSPKPVGFDASIAFVFPGMGNHHLGMGVGYAVHWPLVLRELDAANERLASQLMAPRMMPYLLEWAEGWEDSAEKRVASDLSRAFLAQAMNATNICATLRSLGIWPDAALGYGMGEISALFGLGAWKNRDELLERLQESQLFRNELAGAGLAARRVFGMPDLPAAKPGERLEPLDWIVLIVNRDRKTVDQAIAVTGHGKVFRMIEHAPEECVIGGTRQDIERVVHHLRCEAWWLTNQGIMNCRVVGEVADQMRQLFLLPTNKPSAVRFYSSANAAPYEVTREAASNSILAQATTGFSFVKLIDRAYEDGARIFIECGTQGTCTRAIRKILTNRPHAAIPAAMKGHSESMTLFRLIARLITERCPGPCLDYLYGPSAKPIVYDESEATLPKDSLISIERPVFNYAPPAQKNKGSSSKGEAGSGTQVPERAIDLSERLAAFSDIQNDPFAADPDFAAIRHDHVYQLAEPPAPQASAVDSEDSLSGEAKDSSSANPSKFIPRSSVRKGTATADTSPKPAEDTEFKRPPRPATSFKAAPLEPVSDEEVARARLRDAAELARLSYESFSERTTQAVGLLNQMQTLLAEDGREDEVEALASQILGIAEDLESPTAAIAVAPSDQSVSDAFRAKPDEGPAASVGEQESHDSPLEEETAQAVIELPADSFPPPAPPEVAHRDPESLPRLAVREKQHATWEASDSRPAPTPSAETEYQPQSDEASTSSEPSQTEPESPVSFTPPSPPIPRVPGHLDATACLAFSEGKLADAFGSDFADIDHQPHRLRTVGPPIFAPRYFRVEKGLPGELEASRAEVSYAPLVTTKSPLDEDHLAAGTLLDTWQAALVLASYAGLDRSAIQNPFPRLTEAEVVFHTALPSADNELTQDVEIGSYTQRDTAWCFDFAAQLQVENKTLLSIKRATVHLHSSESLATLPGIVVDEPIAVGPHHDFWFPVSDAAVSTLDSHALRMIAGGDLAPLGTIFEYANVAEPRPLPSTDHLLLDAVTKCHLQGGTLGLGLARAEAAAPSKAWFFQCQHGHDKVVPLGIAWEGCLQTLSFLLASKGWLAEQDTVTCAPVPDQPSHIRVRGNLAQPVKRLAFEVEVKRVGYRPEPFALADTVIYADDQPVARIVNLSLRLIGLTEERIREIWTDLPSESPHLPDSHPEAKRASNTSNNSTLDHPAPESEEKALDTREKATIDCASTQPTLIGDEPIRSEMADVYSHEQIKALSEGKATECFGEKAQPLNDDLSFPRLPGKALQLLDRVTFVQGSWGRATVGDWIEARYRVPANAWYFAANRQAALPLSILCESAFQACSWHSIHAHGVSKVADAETPAQHRRLIEGSLTNHREVMPNAGDLIIRSRLARCEQSADAVQHEFAYQVWNEKELVQDGKLTLELRSGEAAQKRSGVRGARERIHVPSRDEMARGRMLSLPSELPLTPEDAESSAKRTKLSPTRPAARMPSRAMRLIVDLLLIRDGGPDSLGFVRGETAVDPRSWFFAAHCPEDPVFPASLGLEALTQLLKVYMLDRWANWTTSHRFESSALCETAQWTQRGVVTPTTRRMMVEAIIRHADEEPARISPRKQAALVKADGFLLADGAVIGEFENLSLRLVPMEG